MHKIIFTPLSARFKKKTPHFKENFPILPFHNLTTTKKNFTTFTISKLSIQVRSKLNHRNKSQRHTIYYFLYKNKESYVRLQTYTFATNIVFKRQNQEKMPSQITRQISKENFSIKTTRSFKTKEILSSTYNSDVY